MELCSFFVGNCPRLLFPRNLQAMYTSAVIILILLIHESTEVSGSGCYFDHCQNLTDSTSSPGVGCALTKVENGKDCAESKLWESSSTAPRDTSERFYLYTWVQMIGDLQEGTAFSLLVLNANFKRLVTRYQSLENANISTCEHVEFYSNETYPTPTELYISCPFPYETGKTADYKLQILVVGQKHEYVKQYIFKVPDHRYLGRNATVKDYTPFAYIDISDPAIPLLNVQLHPKKHNVTEYKIWLVNNETNFTTAVHAAVPTDIRKAFVTYNFTVASGAYYFKVAAIHPDCGESGCANSTTPVVIINESSYHVLIMIVSTVWIPPAAAYALYRTYKHFKKKGASKCRKPKCLLIYTLSRPSHTAVLIELTKYLRACNIDAIIDALDSADASEKDSLSWCKTAFGSAHAILVVSSPPGETTNCTSGESELLRALKENYADKTKRYFTVQLPYCKMEDVPEEARRFKQFHLPEELAALVKTLHCGTRSSQYNLPADKELLNSIKTAETDISKDVNALENVRETDGLLRSEELKQVTINPSEQTRSADSVVADLHDDVQVTFH